MLDLLKLESFRMVANTGSFTRAAAELGYSQSSVTAHVQSLEREVGAPLFERTRFSREIALTDIGRRTLEYANRLLALAEETSIAIHSRSEPSGHLKICTSPLLLAYRLPALLRQYQLRYPQVKLCISSYSDARTLAASVTNGVVDVAFVLQERTHSDRVVAETLGREELTLVCSPEYPLVKKGKSIDLAAIAEYPALFTDSNCTMRAVFERALAASGQKVENTIEAGSIEAVKRCAAACLGFGVLPAFACEREIRDRELVSVPVKGLEMALEFQVVRNARNWLSPAIAAICEMAEKQESGVRRQETESVFRAASVSAQTIPR